MTSYPKKDSQKGKLYAAERAAFRGSEWDERLTDDEVRREINRGVQWLRNKYGDRAVRGHGDIEVRFPANGYGGAYLRYGANPFFSFTPASRTRWIVLHELAHAVIPGYHPEFDGDRRGHGWCFADVYLALVQHYFGVEWAKKLRGEFKARNVRYRPKRKRNPNTVAPTPPRRKKATTVWVARLVRIHGDDIPEWAGDIYLSAYGSRARLVDLRKEVYIERPNVYGAWDVHQATRLDHDRFPPLWRVTRESLLKNIPDGYEVEAVEVDRELVDSEFASESLVA